MPDPYLDYTPEAAVERGYERLVQFLGPNWPISLVQPLDMTMCRTCIVGQLTGVPYHDPIRASHAFTQFLHRLFQSELHDHRTGRLHDNAAPIRHRLAALYGFDTPPRTMDQHDQDSQQGIDRYVELAALWCAAIVAHGFPRPTLADWMQPTTDTDTDSEGSAP